jgi:hypothetical protein
MTQQIDALAVSAHETAHCMKVVARRDENGYACAIDIGGVTVLHLNPGTERNEVCADLIAEALESLDDAKKETFMVAVRAYRFLDRLKRGETKK